MTGICNSKETAAMQLFDTCGYIWESRMEGADRGGVMPLAQVPLVQERDIG